MKKTVLFLLLLVFVGCVLQGAGLLGYRYGVYDPYVFPARTVSYYPGVYASSYSNWLPSYHYPYYYSGGYRIFPSYSPVSSYYVPHVPAYSVPAATSRVVYSPVVVPYYTLQYAVRYVPVAVTTTVPLAAYPYSPYGW
ncbi:MAG TPA: hypothetical protein P5560_06040 [Thermotogota bacterium]|nr:hypothetical protein [Thermotogota bacterium]HRW92499.1 hypothetical protein [Thermotogota bacterium]